MQLTVKTLQQEQFKLEVEATDSILSVKEKIQSTKNHPVDNQKLIFSGKILDNAKTVQDYNISEKDFLVVMISKPKVTKPATAASSSAKAESTVTEKKPAEKANTDTKTTTTSTPSHATADTTSNPPAPAAAATTTTTTATATTPASAPSGQVTGDSQLVTGAELEQVVQNMMEMGFERDQIMRALRASYNNPERAVEYLFNGIPESVEREFQAAQQQQQQQQQDEQMSTEAATASPPTTTQAEGQQHQNLFTAAQQHQQQQQQQQQQQSAGGVDFSQLRNTPQFQQLRQLVQTNPNMIAPLLQQLGQSNPELLRIINADPQGFLQALMEEGGDGADVPQGSQVIQVTQEEKEAIDRLEGLGFERALAIEAYFACDKNEELAANYLLERGLDDFE